jgi:hypothetical protein
MVIPFSRGEIGRFSSRAYGAPLIITTSLKPALSSNEVRNTIEVTADKVGSIPYDPISGGHPRTAAGILRWDTGASTYTVRCQEPPICDSSTQV